MNLRNLSLATGVAAVATPVSTQKTPEPYGLTPSARQVEWYNREMVVFFHFGTNIFEEYVSEDDGCAPAAVFNPTVLDCGQWMRTLRSMDVPSAIITVKYAGGFCLWPNKYTDYGVKSSAWRNGKGDVVCEFVDTCEEYGVKTGIYLGSHDQRERPSPLYTTEGYEQYYDHQLEELMGDYGKVWETQWGGTGADGLTTPVYTHWYKIMREKQLDCTIFGTKGSYPFADVRWTGNEPGKVGDPCWLTTDSVCIKDEWRNYEGLNEGVEGGDVYIPAKADVSIRPSWLYHAEEDSYVKSAKELQDIYCTSIEHNSALLLSFSPDRRRLIHPTDSLHAVLLKQRLDETLGDNLLAKARVKTTNGYGDRFRPGFLTGNNKKTHFAGQDGAKISDIVLTLPRQTKFGYLMIQEMIELGHRATKWSVEYSNDGRNWTSMPGAADKQTVGYKWIMRFEPVKAKQVRLRILGGFACPAIHTLGVYKQSVLFQ